VRVVNVRDAADLDQGHESGSEVAQQLFGVVGAH
jgi:hypothetical protein